MATLDLFISTTENRLIASLVSSQTVDPGGLPLYYGDTVTLNLYLLKKGATINPVTYAIVKNNGLQLFLYLDDGTIGGTIHTQQITWTPDSKNDYVTANLSLNTAALATLIGTGTSASSWLKIGYVQNGLPSTVLSQKVNIGVGLPSAAAPVVPAGQTPLSMEVALATFLPLQPVNGQALQLASLLGKKFAIFVSDNADGGGSVKSSQLN